MTISPEVLQALLDAGASAEMIVAAVNADSAKERDRADQRRAQTAERVRRHRAGRSDGNAGNALQTVTPVSKVPPLPPSLSPAPLSHPPIPPSKKSLAQDFSRFWAVCPRKVGKGQAEKAFATAVKLKPADQLIEAMTRFAQSVAGTEAQFIPHPATWLNGKRWEDEAPTTAVRPSIDISALPEWKQTLAKAIGPETVQRWLSESRLEDQVLIVAKPTGVQYLNNHHWQAIRAAGIREVRAA